MEDSAIADPCFSRVENPFGFPDWFNYTPEWSASESLTITKTTIYMTKFTIKGKMLHLIISAAIYFTGSPGPYVYVTAPVTPMLPSGLSGGVVSQSVQLASGAWVDGQCDYIPAYSKFMLQMRGAGVLWNVQAYGNDIRVQITYEI